MESLRLQNVRSFVDTGPVPIKPLTLLVGSNSSGKSTFLRSLPLLRQSVETATDSPILWFGEYVDFGTIEHAARLHSADKTVTFEFDFLLSPTHLHVPNHLVSGETLDTCKVTLSATLEKRAQGGTRIARYKVSLLGQQADICFSESGRMTSFRVQKHDFTDIASRFALSGVAYVLPSFVEDSEDREVVYQPFAAGLDQNRRFLLRGSRQTGLLTERIFVFLRSFMFHGNTSDETVRSVAQHLRLGSRAAMIQAMLALNNIESWQDNVRQLAQLDTRFNRLLGLIIAYQLPSILEQCDYQLAQTAAHISYMGPFRAVAQRYYRSQDLAVNEVDYTGKNLAMFLRSLSATDRRSFTEFCERYFGFDVLTKPEGGHVTITIKEKGSADYLNLVDLGFGYSQILPVIAQIWNISVRRKRRNQGIRRLFALEQPELHLHPAYQAKLGDLLAGATKSAAENGVPLRVVVETHSESLVNRLGVLIREGQLDPNVVQIVLFEYDSAEQRSKVSFARYDESGDLVNWPFGFFSPDVEAHSSMPLSTAKT